MKLKYHWYKFLLKLPEYKRPWLFIGSIMFLIIWPFIVLFLTGFILCLPAIALIKPDWFLRDKIK